MEAAQIKKGTPPAGDTLAALEREAVSAATALERAEALLGDATVDLAEGRIEIEKLKPYRQGLEDARMRVAEIDLAMNAARNREAVREAEAQRKESAQAWRKAVAVADHRLEALNRLDDAATAFAAAWRDVEAANESLYATLPRSPDPDAAKLRLPAVADLISKELARGGVTWAHDMAPSMLISQPLFRDIMRDTPKVIRAWADNYSEGN